MSWLKGIKGLSKAVARQDRAPTVVINHRRMKCRPCPARKGLMCGLCKCIIMAKTAVVSEECPGGRW